MVGTRGMKGRRNTTIKEILEEGGVEEDQGRHASRYGGAFERDKDQSFDKRAQNKSEWTTMARQALTPPEL